MFPFIDLFDRKIGTYGICMLLGFALAGFLAYRKGKSNGLIWEYLLAIAATTLGGALLCGGALYIFVTYSWSEIWSFIQQGNFQFLSGGIVFYGGLIGGIGGALLGIYITGTSFSVVERAVVPFIPIGHAIGRIGCVLGGCCYGFPYEGPCAIYYPNSLLGLPADQGYFPVQPLESLVNIGICFLLLWQEKRIKRTTGMLFSYLALYAISRFFLEMLRGDAIRGLWDGISTSQWISIGLLLACCVRLVILKFWPAKVSLHQSDVGSDDHV